jgi:hypothetical protein
MIFILLSFLQRSHIHASGDKHRILLYYKNTVEWREQILDDKRTKKRNFLKCYNILFLETNAFIGVPAHLERLDVLKHNT